MKALVEVESGILLAEQQVKFEGKILQNTHSLASLGIKDGELIEVQRIRPQAPPAVQNPLASALASQLAQSLQQVGSSPPGNNLAAQLSHGLQAAMRGGGASAGGQSSLNQPLLPQAQAQSRVDPEAYRTYVKSSPEMLQQLLQSDPELARAVLADDKNQLVQLLNRRAADRQRAEMERQRLILMLENDPFNYELQKKIETIIEQEQIDSNMEMAIEHNPESFGRVVMLYIDSEVNGTKLKAFVDSGAQQTIMSADCAKRCGIYRFMDRRFAGIAKGVGTAKIAGRVHMTAIKIGKLSLPVSVTILEDSSMEFLLGLDMLRRHQCSIDLSENCLKIGAEKVPFLGEGDLPMHLRDVNNQQPGDELRSSGAVPAQSSNPPQLPASEGGSGGTVSSPFSEDSIKSLVDMGFSRAQALEALTVTNGDVSAATNYLLTQ